MTRKKKAKAPTPVALRAKDLIKLATRGDPRRPVVIMTESGAEFALLSSGLTGSGEIDIDGVPTECIVIASVDD